MKTPTKITWIGERVGWQCETWTAIDEHGQKMGRVERHDQGNTWVWDAWPAFAHGESRRKRGAMHECEKAIFRDWPETKRTS
jgi:hypothetical protein